MRRRLAHAFGLLLGCAGVSIALRLTDAIGQPLTPEEDWAMWRGKAAA